MMANSTTDTFITILYKPLQPYEETTSTVNIYDSNDDDKKIDVSCHLKYLNVLRSQYSYIIFKHQHPQMTSETFMITHLDGTRHCVNVSFCFCDWQCKRCTWKFLWNVKTKCKMQKNKTASKVSGCFLTSITGSGKKKHSLNVVH